MNKLRFLITAPGYSPICGGIGVLHKLAQILAELKEETYLLTTNLNPAVVPKFTWLKTKNTIVTEEDIVLDSEDLEQTIVIYPDIINENPLGAKHVVRWLLSTPCNGRYKYGENDFVYLFNERYTIGDAFKPNNKPIEIEGYLNIFYVDFELFKDRKEIRIPNSQCYALRKAWHRKDMVHSASALNVDQYENKGGHKFLADVFNKYETFICYDDHTFLSTIAALCGCQSIVVPRKGLTAEQFHAPTGTEGVAYGFSESELIWAKNTQKLLVNLLKNKEKSSLETVKNFIQNMYNRIG